MKPTWTFYDYLLTAVIVVLGLMLAWLFAGCSTASQRAGRIQWEYSEECVLRITGSGNVDAEELATRLDLEGCRIEREMRQ